MKTGGARFAQPPVRYLLLACGSETVLLRIWFPHIYGS
jgi:hypothetical protein